MGTRAPRRARATGRRTTCARFAAGAAIVALLTVAGTAGASAADGDPGDPGDPSVPSAPAPTSDPAPEPPAPIAVSWTEGIATAPSTVRCSDAIRSAPARPVLLVHGTGMTPAENWSTSYAPFLAAQGRPVCTVALPAYGTGDVQRSITMVATAITQVSTLAGRPIDVLGHSQGAYLPRAALRLDPALAPLVEDVIGLAGVYEAGSQGLTRRCADEECIPALRQLARGSHLLRAIATQPLPADPDYSNIGSTGDINITPQPIANQQVGATSVLVQDICPGREMAGYDHALLAGDAVAAALVMDALDHDGALDASRVSPDTCATVWFDGFDRDVFMAGADNLGPRIKLGQVPAEPTVACDLLVDCHDLGARGKLVDTMATRVTLRRTAHRRTSTRWLSVTGTATTTGSVMVKVGTRRAQMPVRAGHVVRLPISVGDRRVPVTVLSRAVGDTTWVVERHGFVAKR